MPSSKNSRSSNTNGAELQKAPTGISGLDQITNGGLPKGRPTLICGSAGCGKTLLSMEFLVRGATQFDEPGVFMSFEESAGELATNVRSLGFDVQDLIARKKMAIDFVFIEKNEIEENGEYDLDGLFVRLDHAIDKIGAKRVVLDTIEALFSGLPNHNILRAELRRLFRWLKDKGVTAIITGERGDGQLTRYGLEEYVADCVILLDHRVDEQISTRRMRIVKYRGSLHGTNEFPFLIDETGFSVLPITALGLQHEASNDTISTGIERLDTMFDGEGYYRGSTILVSGTAGTGKSTMAAHFVDATCRNGGRAMYFTFEESESQIKRNMKSVGLNLDQWTKKGTLRFHNARPTSYGLEMHLAIIHKIVEDFKPDVVIFDPITNFFSGTSSSEIKAMIVRLIDFLKMRNITSMLLSLTHGESSVLEYTDVGISSLMDTWILLRTSEFNGERNRGIYILKSRGTAHSNQVREFLITSRGIRLEDVYIGSEGVLMGTARSIQEEKERSGRLMASHEARRRQRELDRKRKVLEAQIIALRAEYDSYAEELKIETDIVQDQTDAIDRQRERMAKLRKADKSNSNGAKKVSTNGNRKHTATP